MSNHFDYMAAKPAEPDATGDPGKPEDFIRRHAIPQPKEQVIFASGYQRSKVPPWHLLFEPFLLAMAMNMAGGESLDGPGNPPNYLRATEAEDQYTDDHLRNHLSGVLRGENVEKNLVAVACNAMIRYHCIQSRKSQ